jgi:hypothetical protein
MPVSGLMIAGNAIVVQTALIAASYLYYLHRKQPAPAWPWRSTTPIVVTALVTTLQFLVPEVLPGPALLIGAVVAMALRAGPPPSPLPILSNAD